MTLSNDAATAGPDLAAFDEGSYAGIAPHLQDGFAALGPAFFTRLRPTPLPAPYWVGRSAATARLLGVSPEWLASPEALEALTGNTLLPGSDALRLDNGMRGDTLRALAAAQSYFYRSRVDGAGFTRSGWARSDGKTEVANLFSPYWQARLSDRSVADRSVSWAAQ